MRWSVPGFGGRRGVGKTAQSIDDSRSIANVLSATMDYVRGRDLCGTL